MAYYIYNVQSAGDRGLASKINALAVALGRITDIGLYPESTASYIIHRIGSIYYRKNGTTGAVDDSSSNASTLIQAAITALTSTGGMIFFKKADYTLTTGLVIDNDYTILTGEGAGSRLIAGADIDIVEIQGAGGGSYNDISKVTNLGFTGYGASHTKSAVLLTEAVGAEVIGNYMTSCYYGVRVNSHGDNKIYDNYIDAFYNVAISDAGSQEDRIISNHIVNSQAAGIGSANKKGIQCTQGYNIVALNCVEHIYGATADGLSIGGNHNLVALNIVDSVDREGIAVYGDENTVALNRAWSNGANGISVFTGSDMLIYGNNSFANTAYGIKVAADAYNCLIFDNSVKGNTGGTINQLGKGTKTRDNAGYNHVAEEKLHGSDLFDAAGLTDSANIWLQPADSVLDRVWIFLDAQFVAAGLTDLDITIGDGGDDDGILVEAMNLTSDAVGSVYKDRGTYWNAVSGLYKSSATQWIAYATAVGANLNTTSAGQITFYFDWHSV